MSKKALIDFEGKVVLVSGATSGIGKAIAMMLGEHGARLILVGRNAEQLEEVSGALGSVEHWNVILDLARSEDITPAVMKAFKDSGPIYGLCHAAGITQTLPLYSSKPEQIRSILDVNFMAGIELARVLTRRDVMEPDGGSILYISSIYGVVGKPGVVAYSASKGAIEGAARSMAVELSKRNIRVNLLSPGFVWTDMTRQAFSKLPPENLKEVEAYHLLRTGTVEDVGRAAAFLLAPQSSWITGINLVIDGGYTAH